MIILFPKKKGIKIATQIIFDEMRKGASTTYILGMLAFALRFGAITKKEQAAILEYLNARG